MIGLLRTVKDACVRPGKGNVRMGPGIIWAYRDLRQTGGIYEMRRVYSTIKCIKSEDRATVKRVCHVNDGEFATVVNGKASVLFLLYRSHTSMLSHYVWPGHTVTGFGCKLWRVVTRLNSSCRSRKHNCTY